MYKTLYSVKVHPIQGGPFEFVDRIQTPGAGSAALAQLTANKDIDGNGGITHVIIPLHAVDYAEVTEQRRESEYEDDNNKNCVIPDSGETGTLTIVNVDQTDMSDIHVMFLYDVPGTYGGIDFQLIGEGENTSIVGTIPTLSAGASIVIDGIPVNTHYRVFIEGSSNFEDGLVPGTAEISAGRN